MKRTTRKADWAAGAALLAAVSLATAVTTGCSAGSDKSSSTVSGSEKSAAPSKAPAGDAAREPRSGVPTASPTGPAMPSVANTGLGRTMVGANGFTIYIFLADKTSRSTCSGACAAAWPPVLTQGAPTPGSGVASSVKLGTTQRSDGKTQVTANGHPVYYFAGDTKAGDVKGQGLNQFGAKWWALDPTGKAITRMTSASPSPTGTNTGSSGGGY